MSSNTKVYEDKMKSSVEHLGRELGAVRAGRANPAVLDKVSVDYYGAPTPIQQVASVAVAEARTLTITPWDRTLLRPISKAIMASDVGITPIDDGSTIRLNFPAPTEERRRELVKECREYAEQAKVSIRNIRRDFNNKLERDEELTEDDVRREQAKVQKHTDEYVAKVEELLKEKQSRDFLDRMEGYLAELEDSLMNFRDIEHRGVVKKEQKIIELFYFKFMDIPLLSRMDAVAEYFIDEVETLKGFDLPEEERDAVKSRFYRMYETRDLYVLYNRFLRQEGFPALPQVQYEKRKLRYEDVYPVLYLKYRLETQQEDSGVRHLIVDEMQDYSMIQYLIIQRLFKCKMTILGDREQTMDGDQQDVLTFLPKIFGKDIRRIVMNKSYRNTIEIASYANKLAGITEVELFERHGKPVEEKEFTGLTEALERVVKELRLEKQTVAEADEDMPENAASETDGTETGEELSYETAAVITRTADEAREAYYILQKKLEAEGFDTKERLSLLHRDSTNFKKGLTVTTFYMAKGLEFDQVFSVFPGTDRSPIVQLSLIHI